MLTCPDETAVSVRTCLAAWNAFWNSRFNTAPAETPLLGRRVGPLDLPKYLGFTQDLGVEAGGDLQQVLDGADVLGGKAELPELRRIHMLARTKRRRDLVLRRFLSGNAVDLDPVARVQDGEFADGAHREKLPRKARLSLRAQGEVLAESKGAVRWVAPTTNRRDGFMGLGVIAAMGSADPDSIADAGSIGPASFAVFCADLAATHD